VISKLALVLDIYSSLSLIWRYSYCPVFQGATSDYGSAGIGYIGFGYPSEAGFGQSQIFVASRLLIPPLLSGRTVYRQMHRQSAFLLNLRGVLNTAQMVELTGQLST
ncbi:MAG: hypothetical protein E7J66_26920, partial [Klebsiella pneumoniae]|nr:hypothetical protein [Klebsiella pneumoniae]